MQSVERLELIEALHQYSEPEVDKRLRSVFHYKSEQGRALEVGRHRLGRWLSLGWIGIYKTYAPIFNQHTRIEELSGRPQPSRVNSHKVRFQAHRDGHFPFNPLTCGKRNDPVGYIVHAHTGDIVGKPYNDIRHGVFTYGPSGFAPVIDEDEISAVIERMDHRVASAHAFNLK